MSYSLMEYSRSSSNVFAFNNIDLFSRVKISRDGSTYFEQFPNFNKNNERLFKPVNTNDIPDEIYNLNVNWINTIRMYENKHYIYSAGFFPTLYSGYHKFSINSISTDIIDTDKPIDVYIANKYNNGYSYNLTKFDSIKNDKNMWTGYIDRYDPQQDNLGRFCFVIFIPIKENVDIPTTGLSIVFKDVYGENEEEMLNRLKWTITLEGYIYNIREYLLRTESSYIGTEIIRLIGFTANFYNNSAESNRMDKSLHLKNGTWEQILIKEPTSVQNPTIKVSFNHFPTYNYCYISKFNRFYFITNITVLNNNLYEMTLSVDVLMSFKEIILEHNCYIATNEYIENKQFFNKKAIYSNLRDKGSIILNPLTRYDPVENAYYIMQFVGYSAGSDRFSSALTLSYILNGTALDYIQKQLIDPTFWSALGSLFAGDPTEGIISIRAYPFDFSTLPTSMSYDLTPVTSVSVPYGKDINDITGYIAKISNVRPIRINFGTTINCDSINDLPPYAKYSMYLPFVGIIDLPNSVFPTQVKNFTIQGSYLIDLETGVATVTISDYSGYGFAFIGDCQISRDIPINKSNAVERLGKYVNTAVKITGSAAAIAIGAGAMGATMGVLESANTVGATQRGLELLATQPYEMADKAVSLFSDIATINNNLPMSSGSSNNALLGLDYISPIIIYDKPKLLSKQEKYFGTPVYDNYKLSDLSGYTVVGAIHMENFDNATTEEISIIANVLTSGVIL